MIVRATLALAVAASVVAWTAAQASAATVVLAGNSDVLGFVAGNNEVNDLTVSLDSGAFTFTDAGTLGAGGVTITPGPPCSSVPPGPPTNVVSCPATGIVKLQVTLGNQNDKVQISAPTPATLLGDSGGDILTGGSGNDLVVGDTGVLGEDTVNGGGGDDDLFGDAAVVGGPPTGATNNLDGGAGRDRLNGGGGPDTMRGGDGGDRLLGHGGIDDADGEGDDDVVVGGDGNDALKGGGGNDALGSGEPTDSTSNLPPDRGSDSFDGGLGDDLLRPGAGATQGMADADTLTGGGGRDTVTYEARAAPVTVTLEGAPGDGFPGEGDDVKLDVERLVGGGAGDRLTGGPNADTIDGFKGADTIAGGAGNDTLDGGVDDAESDTVSGGSGQDAVRGNAGDDSLAGDDGRDSVQGGGGDDSVSGGAGADALTGGAGADALSGGADDDSLNGSTTGLVGIDGGDTLRGDAGDDALAGGDGPDVLAGGTGADDLGGGGGSDASDYTDARSSVTVTLDGRATDGEAGERDNVRSDVEDVRGGGVQDTFTGSADDNELDGGAGEDFVDGRRGRDQLRGGSSRDVVRARDGNRDVVDCGRSPDFAIVDRQDVVRNCERSDVGRGKARAGRAVVVRPTGSKLQFGLPGSRRTVPLLDRIEVPVATDLDARGGSVRLTVAPGTRRRNQSASFSAGLFTVLQARSRRPITELRLKGGDFRSCRESAGSSRAGAAQRRRRTIRRLRGRGRGRFRTRGRYSAATVRGTDFTVEDRCDGTLTRVRRGVVVVRDFRRRRTITVRAGRSYLAKAPAR